MHANVFLARTVFWGSVRLCNYTQTHTHVYAQTWTHILEMSQI